MIFYVSTIYVHNLFEGTEASIFDMPHPWPTIVPNATHYDKIILGGVIESNFRTNQFLRSEDIHSLLLLGTEADYDKNIAPDNIQILDEKMENMIN